MSAKYIPIREVVAMVLDGAEKSIGDQDKVWVFAYRGLEDMQFNVMAEPKTVRLPVEGNKTVIMPPDYVSWNKIGLIDNNGQVSTLRVNNALTNFRDNNPNRLTDLAADISGGWFGNPNSPYLNYFTNYGFIPLYGIGGGLVQFGECRIDEKHNIIVLPPNYPYPDILFEYISCPEKDQDYLVDRRFREPLIAFCEWKLKIGTEQSYYARLTESRRKIKPVKLQEFNQVIRENMKFCLKS